MRIDEAQVRKLGALARLELRDEEIPRLVEEMSSILEHLERLASVGRGLAAVDSLVPAPASRADEPQPGLDAQTFARLPGEWRPPYVVGPPSPAHVRGGDA